MKRGTLLLAGALALALVAASASPGLAAQEGPPKVRALPAVVRGEVLSKLSCTLVLRTGRGPVLVVTDADTVFRISGLEVPCLDDVAAGDVVIAFGRRVGRLFHARIVMVVRPDAELGRVGGRVTGIEGNALNVDTRGGQAVIVLTDEDTVLLIPGVDDPALSDVPIGRPIGAVGLWNDDGSLESVLVVVTAGLPARIRVAGEVSEVNIEEGTLVVEADQGAVAVQTDQATRFLLPDGEATLEDVPVPSRVVCAGRWTTEGTFHARLVLVRRTD
jgi:hypothetical protein